MSSLRGYIDLVRPANVTTALADVLAGFALSGLRNHRALPWLLAATVSLYAGGIVLNDYFDRDLDRVERPERPIPSARVSARSAAWLGSVFLMAGVLFASRATDAAAVVAVAIAVSVLLYDTWGKRFSFIAPVNMGLCRALNLLLGVAAAETALKLMWPISVIPFAYIAAVTSLSRGEVHGGRRQVATVALVSLGAALTGLAMLVFRSAEPAIPALVLALLAWRVLPPFVAARRVPEPGRIRTAVKRGVLSLVLVNAVIGTVYAGPVYGAAILVTALIAGWLARLFPVT